MKRIKILVMLIIIALICLISSNVFATINYSNENKVREKLFKETLDNYLEQYMKEDTPEDKKIVSYEMSGFGISKETDNMLAVNINFRVEAYSKNSTTWSHDKNSVNNREYYCFAKYKKIDGGYELERVSEIPENYDKFLEAFEKYNENKETQTKENVSIQGQQSNSNSGLSVANKISILLYVMFAIIFIIGLTVILRKKK